jgi:hypothetical protein
MNARFLALLLIPHLALAAPQGWLSGKSKAAAPAPQGRDVRLSVSEQHLGKVLPQLLRMAFPDGAVRSAVPSREDKRKVTLHANGKFEHVLEALGAAANLNLVQAGDEIRAQGFYEAPPPRPPGEEDLKALGKQVSLRASDQDLGKVLNVLGTFTGKMVVLSGLSRRRKVNLNIRGNVAQALEALGSMTRLRMWIDGPLLRVGTSCVRRERAYARPPSFPSKLVSLRAHGQELGKVASVLTTFWGGTIAVVADPLRRTKLDIDLENATPLQVTAAIEDQLEGADVFLDGPFLRVQPRALPCDPAPSGGAWEALDALLYEASEPERTSPEDW